MATTGHMRTQGHGHRKAPHPHPRQRGSKKQSKPEPRRVNGVIVYDDLNPNIKAEDANARDRYGD